MKPDNIFYEGKKSSIIDDSVSNDNSCLLSRDNNSSKKICNNVDTPTSEDVFLYIEDEVHEEKTRSISDEREDVCVCIDGEIHGEDNNSIQEKSNTSNDNMMPQVVSNNDAFYEEKYVSVENQANKNIYEEHSYRGYVFSFFLILILYLIGETISRYPLYIIIIISIVIAAPIWLVTSYTMIIKSASRAVTFKENSYIAALFSGRFLKYLFSFVISVMLSFSLLTSIMFMDNLDWLVIAGMTILYIFFIPKMYKFLSKESEDWILYSRVEAIS